MYINSYEHCRQVTEQLVMTFSIPTVNSFPSFNTTILCTSNVITSPPLGNRLYRYNLTNDTLVNPKLLLDLPTTPGPSHNACKIAIGPDNNLYISIGDVDGSFRDISSETKVQNSRRLITCTELLEIAMFTFPYNQLGLNIYRVNFCVDKDYASMLI